jgi:tryptophan 7-halogenase
LWLLSNKLLDMPNIMEKIQEALDLTYLEKWEFPSTDFNSIGILGGGTAGYLTALALKKSHPHINLNVLESSRIPVIGVGESTTTEILPFLHHFLEIDPVDFFEQVEPTLKLGIQFDWGKKDFRPFNFNFYASHHHESLHFENNTDNANWPSVLMNQGRIPIVKTDKNEVISLLSEIPFSYHMDNKKFITYLKSQLEKNNIEIIDTEITGVNLTDDGSIKNLVNKEGLIFSYDLYLDCSGFRSKLLGESLKTPFESFSSTLVTDRALTFSLPNNNKIDSYTSAITHNSGWCWKIPMRKTNHFGYVYSSQFCSDEEALLEVQNRWGLADDYKTILFRSGRYKKVWNKNVMALGNAQAFIEPLESTAIQTLIHSIMLLCRLMPQDQNDSSNIQSINSEVAANWDSFRWFLGSHYKYNEKLDTPFWQWNRSNVNLGHSHEIYDLFQKKAPLSKGHFGTSTGYSAYAPLVFNSYSYDSLFFGQKVLTKKLIKPQMEKAQYFAKIKTYNDLAQKSLTAHELFSSDALLFENIIPQLFEDTDSWIYNTPI